VLLGVVSGTQFLKVSSAIALNDVVCLMKVHKVSRVNNCFVEIKSKGSFYDKVKTDIFVLVFRVNYTISEIF
jgi:hypothetical protein